MGIPYKMNSSYFRIPVTLWMLGTLIFLSLFSITGTVHAHSYDTSTLSDTYQFRGLQTLEFEDPGNASANTLFGELTFSEGDTWTGDEVFRYTSNNMLTPATSSGTFVVNNGGTFTLHVDGSPNVAKTHLAVSPDTDVILGIQGDTNTADGLATNALQLFTRRHTEFSLSSYADSYHIRILDIKDMNNEAGNKELRAQKGTVDFDGAGNVTIDFNSFLSNGASGSSAGSFTYDVIQGETVQIDIPGGSPSVNLATPPDTSVLVGTQGDTNTADGVTEQSLSMAVHDADTNWTQSDLNGSYFVQILDFRDFEDLEGQQRARSLRGRMEFDGSGNWNADDLIVYSSNDVHSRETISGTYTVHNGETFTLQPSTSGVPAFDLAMTPSKDVITALRGDTNTNSGGFAHQSLLAGVRAIHTHSSSPNNSGSGSNGGGGGGGCLIERIPGLTSAEPSLRWLRDTMLSTRAGRTVTYLYYHL